MNKHYSELQKIPGLGELIRWEVKDQISLNHPY